MDIEAKVVIAFAAGAFMAFAGLGVFLAACAYRIAFG